MDIIDRENTYSDTIKCQSFGIAEPELENSTHLEESFVVVCNDEDREKYLEQLNNNIEELEKRNKKLENDYEKLEKRHGELLKLMNELLKIKPSNHIDCLDNLDEIRKLITQILYNEVRRHTVFSFTPILGSYTTKCQQTFGIAEPELAINPLGVALHGNYFPIIKANSIHHINSNNSNNSDNSNNNLNVD